MENIDNKSDDRTLYFYFQNIVTGKQKHNVNTVCVLLFLCDFLKSSFHAVAPNPVQIREEIDF